MKGARGIALTGATGFLGAPLLGRLAGAGADVLVIGRRPVPHHAFQAWSAVSAATPELAAALSGVSTVVHAAAHIPTSMDDPSEAWHSLQVNALGTMALLLGAKAAGVKRFVLISSANLIERRPQAIADDAYPGRHHTQAPFYLTSKLLAETYVLALADPGMQVLIIRPSSMYGLGGGGVLVTILDRLRRNLPLDVRDGGRHEADYVFVDDVADLVAQAALSEMQGFLNAGSGVATDLLTVVELAQALLPASTTEVRVRDPIPGQPPSGSSALDITRARKAFGFKPRSLREGLPRLLE